MSHRILALHTRGFRNLAPLELSLGAQFNVLSGENGQGKSNVLEAIHYAATLASFRGGAIDDLIQTGEQGAFLGLTLEASPLSKQLEVRLDRDAPRSARLDGKRPRTTQVWRNVLPAVLFHPGELQLAQGGPEGRRRLLDDVLSELDGLYASTLATYVKALRSRNRLLKSEPVQKRAVQAFDPILAASGAILGQARARLVSELAPIATRVFHELFDGEVPIEIAFSPRVEPREDALLRAYETSYEKDVFRGFTAEGPHADDVALRVKARTAKHHASQGQQRALVLALKLAELEVLSLRSGRVPIFLLDDVTSELDSTRNRRLFHILSRMGGQVFLTTTRADWIELSEARVDFDVKSGRVLRLR